MEPSLSSGLALGYWQHSLEDSDMSMPYNFSYTPLYPERTTGQEMGARKKWIRDAVNPADEGDLTDWLQRNASKPPWGLQRWARPERGNIPMSLIHRLIRDMDRIQKRQGGFTDYQRRAYRRLVLARTLKGMHGTMGYRTAYLDPDGAQQGYIPPHDPGYIPPSWPFYIGPNNWPLYTPSLPQARPTPDPIWQENPPSGYYGTVRGSDNPSGILPSTPGGWVAVGLAGVGIYYLVKGVQ